MIDREKEIEEAVNSLMKKYNIPEKNRINVQIWASGLYHIGKKDAKKEMLEFLNENS